MADESLSLEVETPPLTDWPNAPTVAELKQDLLDSTPSHSAQKQKIAEWLDNLNVTGKALVNAPKGNSTMVPKTIRKQAEWRYASLSEPFLSSDDIFNVRPVSWEDREAAAQNQLVLAHQFNNQIDKVSFIDEYVRTAVDEGTVVLRTGWEFEEENYEEKVPQVTFQVNPAIGPLHAQIEQLRIESPSQYDTDVPEELKQAHELSLAHGQPIEPVITGYTWQTKVRTVKNQPTVEVCDYRNVIIDPTCKGDIDKAGFVVYHFESSLSALKKDGKYKNLDHIRIETNSILGEPDHAGPDGSQTFNFSDKARKKFVVYEYWGFWDIDGSGTVKPIVAAWVGDTLIRLEENPYPDKKIPFIVVQYLPVRRANYGEPDGALLEDNQKIIGAVTRGMIDIMGKSANGQTGVRKDFLDATNRRKFDRGQDYDFNPGVDPRVGVFMHTYPEIPASAEFMLDMQNREAESMTGVKSFSQGISGAALGDVASLGRGALDAASKRELGILRRLSNGIIKVGRKFISMNSEFLSDKEVIRVTNDKFVTVRRDDLAGAFDLKLSISTAEEDEAKARELAFMLQTMGNNMDPALSRMILSDIATLRKMPDLAKKIRDYQPQPDPIAQRKAQLEVALLEAEVVTERAKSLQLQSNAQLSVAKAGTEEVKQENLQSDTDQRNLDFVEQESGVKQERELQKQGEQARAQTQMKVLEHQFNRQEKQEDFLREYILNKNK